MLNEMPPMKPNRPKSEIETFLGEQGNLTDNTAAHLTDGEIVIPREALTPELMASLESSFQQAGLDLSAYMVGSGNEHVNEKTGMPEFAAQPGVGRGARNRGARLGKVSSRVVSPEDAAMAQQQREASMAANVQGGGVPAANIPATPAPYDGRDRTMTEVSYAPPAAGGAPGGMAARPQVGGALAKLKGMFAQRKAQAGAAGAGGVPYPIPGAVPDPRNGNAQFGSYGPGTPRVLTPQEVLADTEADFARNPQAYQSNPHLMRQLTDARAAAGVVDTSSGGLQERTRISYGNDSIAREETPEQHEVRKAQQTVGVAKPAPVTPAAPAAAAPTTSSFTGKATTPAAAPAAPSGGMGQMQADFAKKKATSALANVNSAEVAPDSAAGANSAMQEKKLASVSSGA